MKLVSLSIVAALMCCTVYVFAQQQGVTAAEMEYVKNDFVPGDEIIFDDDCSLEKMGEFPSQWDLLHGNVEIAAVKGEKTIAFQGDAEITPFMKTPKNYLPESFTIEFDFYVPQDVSGYWKFRLNERDEDGEVVYVNWWTVADAESGISTSWIPSSGGDWRNANTSTDLSRIGWHRFSLSFNKRALKVYVDGKRVANVPNVMQPGWFTATAWQTSGGEGYFLRNIRISKGAVPLYDRMMNDGKFITYGITFDVGKSTLKPESMSEINRIATMLKENPELSFSVEGHTDNTGSAATNQTLSEARCQAVVDKLVAMGITANRLKAAGKGQTAPIADNNTDEGRAKNRRVEFVKM
jgi:outer membrane protein OmpA-like peptidoglycan-associated protein